MPVERQRGGDRSRKHLRIQGKADSLAIGCDEEGGLGRCIRGEKADDGSLFSPVCDLGNVVILGYRQGSLGHREQCWMVHTRGGGVDGHGDVQKDCRGQPLRGDKWSESVPAQDQKKVRLRVREHGKQAYNVSLKIDPLCTFSITNASLIR